MIKATRVMPALLLQKRSKTSKPKDHLKALEKRLRLWEEGNTNELVNESNTMQERLPSTNSQINIEKIPSKFNKLILKSNVNGALRLLTNNMNSGTLPLSNKTNTGSETSRTTTSSPPRYYKAQKDKYTVLFMKTLMKI